MNIFGESFHPEIIKQIEQRQKRYGSTDRSPQEISYLNAKTSWVKLVSSVNIEPRNINGRIETEEDIDNRLKLMGVPTSYKGNALAKEFVLFNGTSTQNKDSYTQRAGVTTNTSVINDFAYGLGGLEFGIRPMPGIISAEIRTLTRGSIKDSTVQIKAHNRTQFQIIDALYLRLGYPILLEWGHTIYFDNKGNYKSGKDINWSIANDFLEGKLNDYYKILSKIQENRIKSNGNYDALLGKVKNYNWTFDKDGTFLITLSIISVGDVIESLQANINLPSTPVNNPSTQTGQSQWGWDPESSPLKTIQSAGNKHTIGNMLVKAQEAVDSKGIQASGNMKYYSLSQENNSNLPLFYKFEPGKRDIVRVDWGPTHSPEYYYRLGAFLQELERTCLIYTADNTSVIKIDYDDANYVYYDGYQVSADPTKCIVYREIGGVTLFPECEKYVFGNGEFTVGLLMNVYINFTFILEKLDMLKDSESGKVPLIAFLDAICAGINSSLGYKNMISTTIDETTNTIRFIDETPIPNQEQIIKYLSTTDKFKDKLSNSSNELAVFDIYGYYGGFGANSSAGFIKDFSLSTGITPALSTILTVGATANGRVVGEDATAFSKWNVGLKNRVTENLYASSEIPDKTTVPTTTEPTLEEVYKDSLAAYYKFIIELSEFKWNDTNIDTYPDTLRTFLTNRVAYISSKTPESQGTLSTGFIPISLNLTMEGLSGMKVYQQFLVDTTYLPSNYPTVFKFLIRSITHKIENNIWSTSIETMAATTNTFNVEGDPNFDQNSSDRAAARGTDVGYDVISRSKENIVKKIIDFAKSKGITDKSRLTALLTVAQAESGITPGKSESFKYSVSRAKEVFPSALRGKSDEQIAGIFSSEQKAAEFLYGGKFGNNQSGDGYKYRGRGLTQITFKDNYSVMTRNLKSEGISVDLVSSPDSIQEVDTSVKALVIGKIKGQFGDKLSTSIDYTKNARAIVRTQNGGQNPIPSTLSHYSRALNSVNNTSWIQNLLNS